MPVRFVRWSATGSPTWGATALAVLVAMGCVKKSGQELNSGAALSEADLEAHARTAGAAEIAQHADLLAGIGCRLEERSEGGLAFVGLPLFGATGAAFLARGRCDDDFGVAALMVTIGADGDGLRVRAAYRSEGELMWIAPTSDCAGDATCELDTMAYDRATHDQVLAAYHSQLEAAADNTGARTGALADGDATVCQMAGFDPGDIGSCNDCTAAFAACAAEYSLDELGAISTSAYREACYVGDENRCIHPTTDEPDPFALYRSMIGDLGLVAAVNIEQVAHAIDVLGTTAESGSAMATVENTVAFNVMCAARGSYCRPPTCNPVATECYHPSWTCSAYNEDGSCLIQDWESGEGPWDPASAEYLKDCYSTFEGCARHQNGYFRCGVQVVQWWASNPIFVYGTCE